MFGDPMIRLFWLVLSIIAILALAHFALADEPAADSSGRVFEIRTYTAEDGKLDALNARFRDHTIKLFEKHGITSIGYWIPADEPRSKNTLIYIVAHPAAKRPSRIGKSLAKTLNGKKSKPNPKPTANSSPRSIRSS